MRFVSFLDVFLILNNVEKRKTETVITVTYLVYPTLNDQSAFASGDQLLKDLFKIARDLLERALYSLVFALVQHLYQLLDRLRRLVEVFSSLQKLIPLLREVVVLLERLLVDVSELLEAFVDGMQLLDQLYVAV